MTLSTVAIAGATAAGPTATGGGYKSWNYYLAAAKLATKWGYHFVAGPATDLVNSIRSFAPGYPINLPVFSGCSQSTPQSCLCTKGKNAACLTNRAAFLDFGIPAAAVEEGPYPESVFSIQDQGLEANPSMYASLAASAASQAKGTIRAF